MALRILTFPPSTVAAIMLDPFRALLIVLCLSAALTMHAAEITDPAARAEAGDPVDLLFLKGNIEISFGQPADLDATLVKHLQEKGFRVQVARDFQPLTADFLRQFETVIWVGISPGYAQSRLYSPVGWQGGMHMLTVQRNAELLEAYAREGGGLLLNPGVEELGMQVVPSHRRILSAYGMDMQCAQVRDVEQQFVFYKSLNRFPFHVAWTEAIANHPVTAGVRRIYYPAYTMRWDDNITTLPLYPRDPAWKLLVQGSPTARASWFRGTPYEDGHWKDDDETPDPPGIVAVRDYGKGRVGVVSIGHFHLFYYPYSDQKNHAEILFGPQKGVLMTEGDGTVPSDLQRLLDQLLAWLATPATDAAAIGGYDPATAIEAAPIPEQPIANRAEVWAQDDPMVTGEVRPIRILVGARSAVSDGEGTPAEWAAAAKAAGYGVVAFTERFEATDAARFREFVAACEAASDDAVHLLPGFDVADSLGNRFLLVGKDSPIRPHLLVESEADSPGKALIWTGHMLLGMGEVLPIAARPGWLATVREHGALPPQLYSHCPGVAVATYRDGAQVDDGLAAYQWHLYNASVPVPIAVHEVRRPADLARAATTGLQVIVNGDTPSSAANYLRQGHMSFGGNPMRTYLSSGPIADAYGIDDWAAEPWRVHLALHGDAPITDVAVSDQAGAVRYFRPGAPAAAVEWQGDQGRQHWFYVEARDANGGRLILSPLRTLPSQRAFVRCMDRQNWFSGVNVRVGVSYTGRVRSLPYKGAAGFPSLPGTTLASTPAPMFEATYNGPGLTIVDYVLTHTLVPGGRATGADASPIFNAQPIDGYQAATAYRLYMNLGKGSMPAYYIADWRIRTTADTVASGPAYPAIRQVKSRSYRLPTAEAPIEPPATDAVDLPAGAWIDGFLLLQPLRLAGNTLGWPATAGAAIPAGSQWRALALPCDANELPAVWRAAGFTADTPYTFALTRGRLAGIAAIVHLVAEDGGVAGTLTAAPEADLGGPYPGREHRLAVELAGGNSRWPLALWTAADGNLQPFGFWDGIGQGRLDATAGGAFYFGAILIASNPALALSWAETWTADRAAAQVHNPTDTAITATVRTPSEITDRLPLSREVTVPPGATVRIELAREP